MSLKNTTLFIWDMDGTLINSHPATHYSFNQALLPFLGRELEYSEISKHYGPREEVILEKLVGKENVNQSFELYLKSLQEALNQVQVFNGILKTLDRLKNQKKQLAIFTGRGREGTDMLTHFLNLNPYFSMILTNSEVSNKKPHPEGIFEICKKLSIAPEDAVMIGDSPVDIIAGKSAGTKTVACTWDPLSSKENLSKEIPHHLIDNPDQIIELLR